MPNAAVCGPARGNESDMRDRQTDPTDKIARMGSFERDRRMISIESYPTDETRRASVRERNRQTGPDK